jgi:hypothetical protein
MREEKQGLSSGLLYIPPPTPDQVHGPILTGTLGMEAAKNSPVGSEGDLSGGGQPCGPR